MLLPCWTARPCTTLGALIWTPSMSHIHRFERLARADRLLTSGICLRESLHARVTAVRMVLKLGLYLCDVKLAGGSWAIKSAIFFNKPLSFVRQMIASTVCNSQFSVTVRAKYPVAKSTKDGSGVGITAHYVSHTTVRPETSSELIPAARKNRIRII